MAKKVAIQLDKERHLKFTVNTLVDVEEKLGVSISEIGDDVRVKTLRTLLHAGLVHEDEELTEHDVGELISMDDMSEVQDKLAKAMGGSQGNK